MGIRIGVLGLGHNGLLTTAILQRVVREYGLEDIEVLGFEENPHVGGSFVTDYNMFGSEYIVSPAAVSPYLLTASGLIDWLDLDAHGYNLTRTDLSFVNWHGRGDYLSVYVGDPEVTAGQLESRGLINDAKVFRQIVREFDEDRRLLWPQLHSSPPIFSDMMNMYGEVPDLFFQDYQSLYEGLEDLFQSNYAKMLFAAWVAGHSGASLTSPGTMRLAAMIYSSVQHTGADYISFGGNGLIEALQSFIRNNGHVSTFINEGVRDVLFDEDLNFQGVRTKSGKEIELDFLLSTIHPFKFTRILPSEAVSEELRQGLGHPITGSASMRIHFHGESDLLRYGEDDDVLSKSPFVHVVPGTIGSIATASAQTLYERAIPVNPMITFTNDSAIDRVRAPIGRRLMSMIVSNLPFAPEYDWLGNRVDGGWSNSLAKQYLAEVVQPRICELLPGFVNSEVEKCVVLPNRGLASIDRVGCHYGNIDFASFGSLRSSYLLHQNALPDCPNVIFAGDSGSGSAGITGLNPLYAVNAVMREVLDMEVMPPYNSVPAVS